MLKPKAASEDEFTLRKTARRSALSRLLRLKASPNAHPDETQDALGFSGSTGTHHART